METLRGIVSHFQSTTRVSGGGNNHATTTSYIALFRIGDRPVEFRSASPAALADGDSVIVAGRYSVNTLSADAIRNLTTGATMHASLGGWLFMAVLILIFGGIFSTAGAMFLSKFVAVVFVAVLAGAVYACFRAWQTYQALSWVRSAAA